jgi:hypothetical protein
MKKRIISFASSVLEVLYHGPAAQEVIDFLYSYLPEGDCDLPADFSPHFTYRLDANGEGGKLRLYTRENLELETDSRAEMAVHLINQSCYHLAYHSQGGLLIHAAYLSWAGKGILLPGKTGQGKSTLAAWLIRQGYDYLTDELVYIPSGALDCQGLTRPLNLKRGARPLWQPVYGLPENLAGAWRSREVDLVPPGLLGAQRVLPVAPLHAILFPNYQAQGDFDMLSLSRAQAGLSLMQCLINARNLPEHGFPEITRLARQIPAYRLTYANFEPVAGIIQKMITT